MEHPFIFIIPWTIGENPTALFHTSKIMFCWQRQVKWIVRETNDWKRLTPGLIRSIAMTIPESWLN